MSKPRPTVEIGRLFDRLPPHSLEAEMSLLGSMILDINVIEDVREIITNPDQFYGENHRAIYEAIVGVYAETGTLDLVQLHAFLNSGGGIDKIGGGDYLVTLSESVPSAVNAPHYARIVREKAQLRGIIQAASKAVYEAYHAIDGTDPTTIGSELAAHVVRFTNAGAAQTTMADALREFTAKLGHGETMTPTGLERFDAELGGIPNTGMVTFLGVPSSGKTSLAGQWVWQLASNGRGVRVYSSEMGPENASASIASQVTGVSLHTHRRKGSEPTAEEWRELMKVETSSAAQRIHFSLRNMTAREMLAQAAADKRRGIDVLLLDYIQNIERPQREDGSLASEVETISEGCRILQRISRELGMLVLMVSQMTASSAREKRPPKMSDGVGAGAIQQASDMMIGVYRPCVFDEHEGAYDTMNEGERWADRKAYTELHVLKNKFGMSGMVKATFAGHITRFSDYQPRSFT